MKKTILASLFIFLIGEANAQFRMVGSGSWSTVNDSTYQATITFMADLTGNGYLATDIVDTFRMITGLEKVYRVDTVWGKTFSSATVRVVEYNGTQGAPLGQVMVYDPDGRETVPQAPFGSTGSTAQMQAAVVSYNAKQTATLADGDYGDISIASGVWSLDANSVGSNEIAADAVNASEISTGAVTTLEILDGTIALADLAASAQTDLSFTQSTRVLASSTGADVTLPIATNNLAGLMPGLAGQGSPGGGVDPVNDVLALGDNSSGAIAGPSVNAVVQSVAAGGDLSGTINNLQLASGAVSWGDLSTAVQDSIQAGGAGGTTEIQAIATPNLRDSLNLTNNITTAGVTIAGLADRIAQREETDLAAKTNAVNRFTKTNLSTASTLTVQNQRAEWNVKTAQTAYLDLTASTRLMPPKGAEAGGSYVLHIRQDATGGRVLQYDPAIWRLNGALTTSAYGTATLYCNCFDGRTMQCNVSNSTPSTYQSFLTTYKNDLLFAFIPSMLSQAWVQGPGETPKYKKAISLGDRIGAFVEQSRNAHEIMTQVSSPTYSQKLRNATVGGTVAFQTDTTNFRFRDGKRITQVHSNTFSLYIWAYVGTNGQYQSLIAAGTAASSTGFRLRKNNSNQYEFHVMDGTGTFRFDLTTTATHVNADGWKRILVRSSSDADSIYIKVGSTEIGKGYTTTSISAMLSELFIWYSNSGDWWRGYVGNTFMFNRRISDAEVTALDALSQATLTAETAGFIYPSSATFTPEKVNGWRYSISAADSTGMFTDAAKTDAVNASSDLVYAVQSRVTSTADRDWATTSTGLRPTYLSNQYNGKGTLQFDSLDLMQFATDATSGALTGEYTIFMVVKEDTMHQRCLGNNGLSPQIHISTARPLTSGGNIISRQSHVKMGLAAGESYHNEFGGVAARNPNIGGLKVIRITRVDSLFTVNVNNTYTSSGTLASATVAGHPYILGGSGGMNFKGNVSELWINSNALPSNVADSLTYYWATLYGISNVPKRTTEIYDEDRVKLWPGDINWWEATTDEVDYTAFGRTVYRNGYAWTALKRNKHHIRRYHADGGLILAKYNQAGTLIDTIGMWKDVAAQKLDRYFGYGQFKNDSVFYSLAASTGDSYDPNWGLGTDTIIPYLRTVNVNTGALGTAIEINVTGYSAITSWIFPFDVAFRGDTIYMCGYGNQNFSGEYDLLHCKSSDGGNTWTLVKSWEGNSFSPTQKPEEPGYLETSDGKFWIVYRNDENNTGIWATSASHPNSSTWTNPVKWMDGLSAAWALETSDRILVLVQRGDFSTYPTKVYTSYDMGATWNYASQLDADRYNRYAAKNMYGNAIEWPDGTIEAYWFSELPVNGQDFCTFQKQNITNIVRQ